MRFLAWPLGALVVLGLAAAGGYGLSQLVAAGVAAPGPRTAGLPPTSASPSSPPSPSPEHSPSRSSESSPSPSPTVTPTPEPLPSGVRLVHVVKAGETIGTIARRYGLSGRRIIEFNDLQNPDIIVPGQKLLIPRDS